MFGPQVIRSITRNKQRGPIIGTPRLYGRKADEPRHLALDRFEVQSPARLALFQNQVLQQECALRGIGYHRGKSRIGDGAALDIGEIKTSHCLHTVEDRRDVGHNQALDRGAMIERGGHRHLAAHAVPQQREAIVAARL